MKELTYNLSQDTWLMYKSWLQKQEQVNTTHKPHVDWKKDKCKVF